MSADRSRFIAHSGSGHGVFTSTDGTTWIPLSSLPEVPYDDTATTYSAGDRPSDGSVIHDTPERAKIDSYKAYLESSDSKCKTKLKLSIQGKHFDNDAEVRIGGKEASSVNRNQARNLPSPSAMARSSM